MRTKLYRAEELLGIAAGLALVIYLLSRVLVLELLLAVGLALLLLVVLFSLSKMARVINRQHDNLYTQLECHAQLYSALQPKAPLPSMRGYAGSPDFLLWLHREIKRHQPKTIVEASSGVSSMVSGYTLNQLELGGKVYSLENNAFYANITRSNLKEHELDSTVTVFDAPLVDHQIADKTHKWYDVKVADLPEKIDMLVIDGPPRRTQKLARYPALPLLKERLSENAVILIDDAGREDERKTIKRWQQEFPNATFEHLPCEKGLVRIRLGETR